MPTDNIEFLLYLTLILIIPLFSWLINQFVIASSIIKNYILFTIALIFLFFGFYLLLEEFDDGGSFFGSFFIVNSILLLFYLWKNNFFIRN